MKITKIIIENFKSIEFLEFEIKKHGDSYTTMFLGVNESGKSNILQAMSFLDTPVEEYDYETLHNQKDEEKNPIDLWFYFEFEQKKTYSDIIKKEIINGNILNFEITNIVKNVYLQERESSFEENYNFDIEELTEEMFIKKIIKNEVENGQNVTTEYFEVSKANDEQNTFLELTKELFKEYFKDKLISIIKQYEPSVYSWKPSEKYLISEEDLNAFSQEINTKPALKNIFYLAGYKDKERIQTAIKAITNAQQRSKLQSKIQDSLDGFIKNIWKHNIDVVIDITETGKFTLSIKDSGVKNKHDRLSISGRSEGAKHFISLMLSLSIEKTNDQRESQLILIDEPEAHLHPSGIRDSRNELLRIGENNYVFASTHSPFLVDKINKERNIIIKKNNSAITEKKEIQSDEDIRGDEVLDLAFGINVYKDLLNPHRILVEGGSDKKILQKAFSLKNLDYGITNGIGSNIVQIATKFNHDDIKILVITDDDVDGKDYRNKILKIGGIYNENTVFTIRDSVGSVLNGSTTEDLLGKEFIESKFKEYYKSEFSEECSLDIDDNKPFINQIKVFLQREKKFSEDTLEKLKKKISDDFSPSLSNFEKNFPLLNTLVEQIESKLQ